jgi:hypothetical protein
MQLLVFSPRSIYSVPDLGITSEIQAGRIHVVVVGGGARMPVPKMVKNGYKSDFAYQGL